MSFRCHLCASIVPSVDGFIRHLRHCMRRWDEEERRSRHPHRRRLFGWTPSKQPLPLGSSHFRKMFPHQKNCDALPLDAAGQENICNCISRLISRSVSSGGADEPVGTIFVWDQDPVPELVDGEVKLRPFTVSHSTPGLPPLPPQVPLVGGFNATTKKWVGMDKLASSASATELRDWLQRRDQLRAEMEAYNRDASRISQELQPRSEMRQPAWCLLPCQAWDRLTVFLEYSSQVSKSQGRGCRNQR